MVNSMNDEIPPADGIVPFTGLDHFLSVGEIEWFRGFRLDADV